MGIAALLEQVARATYEERGPASVKPVQWAALRYLAEAGEEARTVSGVARYLGVTMGPASRTVSALVRHGWVATRNNPKDRRSAFLDLTGEGVRMMDRDPLRRLASRIEDLPDTQQGSLAQALVTLRRQLDR